MPSAQDVCIPLASFMHAACQAQNFLRLVRRYQGSDLISKVPACMALASAY